MLSKPVEGWSEFSLDDTMTYRLSYLDDIAFDWVEHAIHGLETMKPFCVKGCLEPQRLLCTVSYWNCHILVENHDAAPVNKENMHIEHSNTSMIKFCKELYRDISENTEDWAAFSLDYCSANYKLAARKKSKELSKMLDRLKMLIEAREECFEKDSCFL